MFTCRQCTRRILASLTSETSQPVKISGYHAILPVSRNPTTHLKRNSSDIVPSRVSGQPYLNAAQLQHRKLRPNTSGQNEGRDPAAIVREKQNLRKELIYLTDPLKLSDHVRYLVFRGQIDKAVELCRLASKSIGCVVAWNCIIDGYMKSNRIKEAFKIYNDMKKRAQVPDSYTYLLLMRGLAPQKGGVREAANKENTERALALYESMRNPNSKIRPSIIHTNALLRVCSYSMDMNALWGILAQIPETGPSSADHLTYTTVLQAIKQSASSSESSGSNENETRERRRRAVLEGREIWGQVLKKWQAGLITIDEALVHAMARVLMQSPDIADWDDVLSLVEQTTNIQRLVPLLGSRGRETAHVPHQTDADVLPTLEESPDVQHGNSSMKHMFQPLQGHPQVQSRKDRDAETTSYAKPGNALLSVILDACSMMHIPRTSVKYWDILTEQHAVKPDLANFHALLRQLALNRSSAKTVLVMQNALFSRDLRASERTFMLALSCCIRDKKNVNALANGMKILDMMNDVRGQSSINVLSLYLKLVLQPECIARAPIAMSRLFKELGSPSHVATLDHGSEFLRSVAGAIHKFIAIGIVADADKADWEEQRTRINQAVTEHYDKRLR